MQYSKFIGLIYPVINSRGNSMLYTKEGLESIVNICIQQIYNEYRWSFQFKTIEIPALAQVAVTDKFKFTILDTIKLPVVLSNDDGRYKENFYPAKSIQDFADDNFYTLGKDIFFKENQDYLFSYLMDYDFIDYLADTSIEIPLPSKFIPALYFNVISQIDLIYTQQLEGEPRASFNKYQYEIDKLKKDDLPAAISIQGTNVA